ncbi:SMP-30/gluconolactonase/LRE family protein [Aquimarina sp. 2201CG5-10]|uniref:SMP-30/gluconolactonase/LRE family protein n=1 Tax=Aquimarina callyspongiae TaxID=3098150 RepID=UPI002AB4CDDC|nr:SMP-30/gluconolactonase/LRE family protein [Aquimarina sp. 2201CG5-10]MDY8136992.1 SMP-30/gluconolactonase/LRE family protein [Aquimarina sp. 2201CG5-10]
MKNFIQQFTTNVSLVFVLVITVIVSISCHGDGFDPEFEVETIVSDFSGNDAVSVDRRGNIYVSEYGQFTNTGGNGTRVLKVSQDGDLTEFLTDLTGPLGNAFDNQGNFYVNDANNTVSGNVVKITPDGTRTILATIDGWPTGMTLDRNNNIYVSNFLSPTVHKITQDGEVTVYATDPRLTGGVGIDFDRQGNLIVGNFSTADIVSIDKNGSVSLIANIPDIVINGFGIGYITVVGNSIFATGIAVNKIFKVSLDGEIKVFAGTGEAAVIDGLVLEASFNGPNGITSDKYGKAIYVSEFGGTGALRKIKLR